VECHCSELTKRIPLLAFLLFSLRPPLTPALLNIQQPSSKTLAKFFELLETHPPQELKDLHKEVEEFSELPNAIN